MALRGRQNCCHRRANQICALRHLQREHFIAFQSQSFYIYRVIETKWEQRKRKSYVKGSKTLLYAETLVDSVKIPRNTKVTQVTKRPLGCKEAMVGGSKQRWTDQVRC